MLVSPNKDNFSVDFIPKNIEGFKSKCFLAAAKFFAESELGEEFCIERINEIKTVSCDDYENIDYATTAELFYAHVMSEVV